MTDEKTYGENWSARVISEFKIKHLDPHEDGYYSLTTVGGWGCVVPPAVGDVLLTVTDADLLEQETVQASRITGWRVNGEWIWRSSDQDIIAENAAFHERHQASLRKMLEDNQEDWAKREAALPEWLRERITYFHEHGGENFKLNGWGYEVIVAEFAALFFDTAPDFKETDEIKAFDLENGASGHQWDFGKALAKAHYEEPDRSLAGTVAALPFNGRYYEND